MAPVNRVDRLRWLEAAGYRYSTFISWPRSKAGSADAEFMRKLRLALKIQHNPDYRVEIPVMVE